MGRHAIRQPRFQSHVHGDFPYLLLGLCEPLEVFRVAVIVLSMHRLYVPAIFNLHDMAKVFTMV